MDLYIDSGRHGITNVSGRISDTEDEIQNLEVIFTEDPSSSATKFEFIVSLVKAPLLLATMALWSYIILPAVQLFSSKDREIEEYFLNQYDADEIPSDSPRLQLISDDAYLWAAANWVPSLMLGYLILSYRYVESWIVLMTVFFGVGISLFFAFLSGMHSTRNRHIAQTIIDHSEQYNEAILVTGHRHHEEVAEILEPYEEVTVINPKQDQ